MLVPGQSSLRGRGVHRAAAVHGEAGAGDEVVVDEEEDGGGDLFGVAVAPNHKSLYLVDDSGSGASANSLGLLH